MKTYKTGSERIWNYSVTNPWFSPPKGIARGHFPNCNWKAKASSAKALSVIPALHSSTLTSCVSSSSVSASQWLKASWLEIKLVWVLSLLWMSPSCPPTPVYSLSWKSAHWWLRSNERADDRCDSEDHLASQWEGKGHGHCVPSAGYAGGRLSVISLRTLCPSWCHVLL